MTVSSYYDGLRAEMRHAADDYVTGSNMLEAAAKLISGNKRREHGDAAVAYAHVARLWSGYLNCPVTPADVVKLMALLKIGRSMATDNPDNLLDAAGYIGLAQDLT
jgi:hypothetical protein